MTVRFGQDKVADAAELIQRWLSESACATAFTGAGISTMTCHLVAHTDKKRHRQSLAMP